MSLMTITISIPEEINDWVEKQIQSGRFVDVSDYFSKLIELDMRRGRVEEQLRSLVDEGIKSGTSTQSIPEIMARIEKRAELARRGRAWPLPFQVLVTLNLLSVEGK